MRKSLGAILTPALGTLLDDLDDRSLYGPQELIDCAAGLVKRGAERHVVGHSSAGEEIAALVVGGDDATQTFLAWGYPHPDEPIGAAAALWLAEAFLERRVPELSDWRLVFVVCADPDQARRQLWTGPDGGAAGFAAGSWRPTHLDLEVDYGFPIEWGPFHQPETHRGRCRTRSACQLACQKTCALADLPPGPLPESLALAEAMRRFSPAVVASLHNTHSGGDYTFLLKREPVSVLTGLLEIPAASGRGRHLGEPIDRGARWLRDAPDLLRERTLAYHARRLERNPDFDERLAYLGNASAAMFIEALDPAGCSSSAPEATLFYHRDFSDPSPYAAHRDRPRAR